MRSECEAEFSKPCAGVVTKGRGRLAAPAHVRFTTEADGVCPCTMYDVRCTTVAPGGAYVRGTMYDVRLRL